MTNTMKTPSGITVRQCIGCGLDFTPLRSNQTRCKPKCGYDRRPSRHTTRAARTARKTFVGVDGEGVNRIRPDGSRGHDYILLSVGNDSLHRNGETLQFAEIMEFLYSCFLKNPDAVYVGFFLGYDFCHWLRTLPEERARQILDSDKIAARRPHTRPNPTPFPVRYAGWEFDLFAGRRWRLRPAVGIGKKNHHKEMFICDVGQYFATSFVKVIDPSKWPHGAPCTESEYILVKEGKAHRDSAELDESMILYNITENKVLAETMRIFSAGLYDGMGIKLGRHNWFGPGRASEQWIKHQGVAKSEVLRQIVPGFALEAGRKSYFGGWFEIFAHGPVKGTVHEYDINSAYPYAIAQLPCLLHGTWTEDDTGSLVLDHAELWGGDTKVGAMLHRLPKGIIQRPRHTRGWYWRDELQAAQRAGLIERMEIIESVSYKPCSCTPPLADAAEKYQVRQSVGKNSPEGVAIKIVLNSIYGKLAQSIGSPTFSNSIWASRITSICRTMILDAIATHPNRTKDLVMVATDGVYFTTPHPSLEISEGKLGAWDHSTKKDLFLHKPGTYWEAGQVNKLKTRGVPAKAFADMLSQISEQWSEWKPWNGEWPKFELTTPFSFVTPKQALIQGWEKCGQPTDTNLRYDSADPRNKRDATDPLRPGKPVDTKLDRRRGRYESRAYLEPSDGGVDSLPYQRMFGAELDLEMTQVDVFGENVDIWGITPDGLQGRVWSDMMLDL